MCLCGCVQQASDATQQGKVFRRLSRMSLQILPFIVLSQCRALSVAISDCQCVDLARRESRASVKIGRGFGSNQIGHPHPQHHLLGMEAAE